MGSSTGEHSNRSCPRAAGSFGSVLLLPQKTVAEPIARGFKLENEESGDRVRKLRMLPRSDGLPSWPYGNRTAWNRMTRIRNDTCQLCPHTMLCCEMVIKAVAPWCPMNVVIEACSARQNPSLGRRTISKSEHVDGDFRRNFLHQTSEIASKFASM